MKPLCGIRVLSLAINLPGPVAVYRLSRLGATVTKIEPPGGDPLAIGSPAWYAALHEEMVVRRLDLKSSEQQVQLDELLIHSDLLVTSNRPAALKRLGLDWPSLSRRYPRLCQVAIVGHSPPDENKAGHDLTYQAVYGLVDPPRLPRTLLADLAGAEWTVSASLALLLARERATNMGDGLTSDARYNQVALADAAAAFAEPLKYGLTSPGGLLGGLYPGYNVYQASDGWVAVAALEPHFLRRLGDELGLDEVTQRALTRVFRYRTAAEWERWAVERDLPVAEVRET